MIAAILTGHTHFLIGISVGSVHAGFDKDIGIKNSCNAFLNANTDTQS